MPILRDPATALRSTGASMLRTVFASAALGIVTACGGGGGGGASVPPETITILKNKTSIDATVHHKQGMYDGSAVHSVDVLAQLTPEPSGDVYPVITVDGQGLVSTFTQISYIQDGIYAVSFIPDTLLSPADYAGSVTLNLYKDSGHSQPYSVVGGTMPFHVTVTPLLNLTVKVDGNPMLSDITPLQASNVISIASGDLVEIDSNLPIAWTWSQGPGFVQVVPTPASTTTAWQATISLAQPPGATIIGLHGQAQDGSTQHLSFPVNVSPK